MNASAYISIAGNATAELVIKKSRFICLLTPVKTRSQAEDVILSVKKAHYGARHNCSAYILGEHGADRRYNDDGEPQGTAGIPIMETLLKRGLTDILAVVTRYFGGVLLGAGGLARAYGGVTAAALENARLVEYISANIYIINADYAEYARLEPLIRQLGGDFSADYTDSVNVQVKMPKSVSRQFLTQVGELFSGSVKCVPHGHGYMERNL